MWIRYNPALKYYEYSNNNGASWAQLPMSAASITEGNIGSDPIYVGPDTPAANYEMWYDTDDPTISLVAMKNQANVFTDDQIIQCASPGLRLNDPAGAVDQKNFTIRCIGQNLYFFTVSDAGSGINQPLLLKREGDIVVGRYIYERGRNYPLGIVTYTTAVMSGNGNGASGGLAVQWWVVGNVLYFQFYSSNITINSGCSNLYIGFPAGFTSYIPGSYATTLASWYGDGSGLWKPVMCYVGNGWNNLILHMGANFTPVGGGHQFWGTAIVPIS